MRAPGAPGSVSKRDMRDESYAAAKPATEIAVIEIERAAWRQTRSSGRRGLPGRAEAMDLHDVDHEEAPEMGKVSSVWKSKLRSCCIVASTSTPST